MGVVCSALGICSAAQNYFPVLCCEMKRGHPTHSDYFELPYQNAIASKENDAVLSAIVQEHWCALLHY